MRDYEELVKALRHCIITIPCDGCPYYSNGDKPSKECSTINFAAADAIEELLAAVPKWISVEERLPEKHKVVLFYIPWNKSCMIGWRDEGGQIRLEGYGGVYERSLIKPSHWTPLPEAPKEE